MDRTTKCEYFERLIHKNGKCDSLFIEQYLNGSGSELESKFWSERSSSRLCFDLYSWLCLNDGVKNFQFEKKLPGVLWKKNTAAGPPNMDVYFETDDKVVFIESKYTEKASWKYKKEKDSENNYPLSEAYWGEGTYKSSKMSPEERFYDEKGIADDFRMFCNGIQGIIDDAKENGSYSKFSWFDPKQETCHLFGIIFYIISGGNVNGKRVDPEENRFRGKKIILSNNVWNCEDSPDCFDIEGSLVAYFKESAEGMMNKIFNGINSEFSFEHHTIQGILEKDFLGLDFQNAQLFGTKKSRKLKDYIIENYKCTKRGEG